MVEIWKEKDEGLKKFQNLCKFRVIQVIRAKKDYENSPEGKEYEKEMNRLNEEIKQEKVLEEQRKKDQLKKSMLSRTATTVQGNTNLRFNQNKNLNLNNQNQNINSRSPAKIGNKYNDPLNPFNGGTNNPYNLPKASNTRANLNRKLPKRKFNYSKNDKEAQEIHQMYMNYDPGEYERVSDSNNNMNNNNNNYYNINPNPNIQINRNNIEEAMNILLKGYEYPGSNEVKINSTPVLFKSEDYYKLRLHIKSVLIPKIIGQLNKNNAEEAYKNSKMLLYYLSIMNPK